MFTPEFRQQEDVHFSTVIIDINNFYALRGIRTKTDHLQGDIGVLVLVVPLSYISGAYF